MALFLVYQKPESIYDDEHGIGYHYPSRIPNGRQVSEGDYLVCCLTSKTSTAGRRIFGIGRIGSITRQMEKGKEHCFAKYSDYWSVSPPLTFEQIGGDPRRNMQHSMNRFEDDAAEMALEALTGTDSSHQEIGYEQEGENQDDMVLDSSSLSPEFRKMLGIEAPISAPNEGNSEGRYIERLNWTKSTDAVWRAILLMGLRRGDNFTLSDSMRMMDLLELIFPQNRNLDGKIRQQMQVLREKGFVEFIDNRGNYRMLRG